MKTLITAIIASLLLPTLGIGQDAELKSAKAKAAVREYERKLEEVDKEIAKQLKDLEKSYQMKAELVRARLLSNLNEAMEDEARRVNLEEANKIKGVIDEAKKTEPLRLIGLMEQAGKKPTKTTKTKNPKVRIPTSAVKFNGHHYAVVSIPMTPNAAQIYAESLGGHLARIESPEENIFAYSLLKNLDFSYFWIDGSDDIEEGKWVYSNGEPLIYTNWSDWRNQPDNRGSGEHHVILSKGGDGTGIWEDQPPMRYWFIIEWDK